MKRLKKAHFTLTAYAMLTGLLLLVAGCAPPPTSNELQQRVEQLLQIQQQQARQLEDLQQQLAALQTPGAPAPETGTPTVNSLMPAVVSPQTEPGSSAIAPSAEEIAALSEAASLYLEAFASIATGRMAEAEAGFRSFIERYPEHEYTGNASYWMAEALLARQKPQRAETVLLGIIDNPRQQNKAPAAMARLVQYYRQSGAQNNATAMLQMLGSRYPESPELKRLMRSTEPR